MGKPHLGMWLGVIGLVLSCVGCGSDDEESTPPESSLAVKCEDVLDSLYAAPEGLSPFTPETRGELVGCAPFASYSAAEVATRLSGVPGVVIESGAIDVYLIAYRTAREPASVEGVSTALVYVPKHRMSEKVPMVLAAHGSVGVNDKCAPTHLMTDPTSFLSPEYFDALYLAWAARGLPVVAPDYAGLGTPGVHDYSNWLDPARSAVDGLRALRSMLPPGQLDGGVLVAGHSQGGGIALTVAALASEAPDLELRAAVATTPGWRTAISVVDALGLSSVPLTLPLRGVAAFTGYAALANLTDDASQHGIAFREELRAPILERVSTLCYAEALTSLDTPATGYVPPATIGDLIDPTFAQQASDCTGGGDCSTLAGEFVQRDNANDPHLSATSPPVLITASTDDDQATIGQVGCIADRVEDDGASLELCVHTGQDHLGMVFALDAYSIDWALAAASGASRPACTGTGQRAPCQLF